MEKELPWGRREKAGVFQVGSGPLHQTVLRGQVNKDRQLTTECKKDRCHWAKDLSLG